MFMSRPRPGSTRSQKALVEPGQDEESNPNQEEFEEDDEESKCTACFFSQKTATITTMSTLALFLLFVIALDLTILETRRRTEAEYYEARLVSDGNGTIGNGSFELVGTPEAYETFQELGYSETSNLISLDLNNVELNITEFMMSVRYAGMLRIVRLRNVRFVGKLPKTMRNDDFYFQQYYGPPGSDSTIQKEYRVEFNQSIGPTAPFQLDQCDKCVLREEDRNDLSLFQDESCLQSALLLFHQGPTRVEKSSQSYHFVNELNADVSMEVKVFGWNFFQLNLPQGTLTSLSAHSETILQDLLALPPSFPLPLKQLHLRACEVTLSTLLRFSSTLTHLTLDSVNVTGFGGERISEIFSNWTQLRELTIKSGNLNDINFGSPVKVMEFLNERGTHQETQLVVAFTDLPSSLKALRLSNVGISSANYAPPIPRVRLHLKLLVLHAIVVMDQKSLDMIQDRNFLEFDRIAWQNFNSGFLRNLHHSAVIPTLSWYNFLKRTTAPGGTTKWILLDTLFSLKLADSNHTEDWGTTGTQMQEFLKGISVPVDHSTRAFVLERSDMSQEPENGLLGLKQPLTPLQWKGHSIEERDARGSWFEALNMKVFLDKESSSTAEW